MAVTTTLNGKCSTFHDEALTDRRHRGSFGNGFHRGGSLPEITDRWWLWCAASFSLPFFIPLLKVTDTEEAPIAVKSFWLASSLLKTRFSLRLDGGDESRHQLLEHGWTALTRLMHRQHVPCRWRQPPPFVWLMISVKRCYRTGIRILIIRLAIK